MSRRRNDGHGGVAQRERGSLRSDRDVALRYSAGSGRRPLQRGLPVGRAHHHLGTEAALEFRRALIVIAVRVADDDVFDVARIEPQRGQAVDDLRLRRPREVGVDDDDAFARAQRPRRMLAGTEPVEVVEHLVRRGVPARPVRRCRCASAGGRAAAPCASASRRCGRSRRSRTASRRTASAPPAAGRQRLTNVAR